MKIEDLKKEYGRAYPAAVISDGVKMPLKEETLFSRLYESKNGKQQYVVSRYEDGSASMSLGQLKKRWPSWNINDRIDFCNSCGWLRQQADFPAMIRYIVRNSGPSVWPSPIALQIAYSLPRKEAFSILVRLLPRTQIGRTCNLTQARAITKHPKAEKVLRKHLRLLGKHRSLWKDDMFVNWVAFAATTCIQDLIKLGAAPEDFEDMVRRLSVHVCEDNRESCQTFLSKYYPWLKIKRSVR